MKFKFNKFKKINFKLLWVFLLFIHIFLFSISFVEIPILSSLFSYTFGLYLGYFAWSYLIIFILYSIKKIFNFNILKIKNLKISIWFLSFLNIFITFLAIFILKKDWNNLKVGFSFWPNDFKQWWHDYSFEKNAFFPSHNHYGFFNIFIYCIIKTISSSIGAILIPFLLLFFSIFFNIKWKNTILFVLIFKKTFIMKYNFFNKKQKEDKGSEKWFIDKNVTTKINDEIKIDDETNEFNFDTVENETEISLLDTEENQTKTKTDLSLTLPFEDPFDNV
ncbi:hypothetical protein [Mesomycoplasma neurolyticum]|uniref:Uncharacterized protein n=1 Tax=Mesomycoplasma neurolyticum TaxID=2120 RepID=A0A449A660_9BACT|nr:hypothetical protein [Mesomycoplasma neurolyticum]VEU59643.1 Uncharacterised protein [Mesomycoplasma neurolyticum]